MQLRDQLSRSLPGIEIHAESFPPTAMQQATASCISMVQWAVVLGAFGGQVARDAVAGSAFAEPLQSIQENKMQFVGMSWFLGSSISASVLKTGAFEVQVRSRDGGGPGEAATVWSGIAHGGRPPASVQEMHDILDALRSAVNDGAAAAESLEGAQVESIAMDEPM